jgi:hypothetical protein
MITSGALSAPPYRITGVSLHQHSEAHAFAGVLAIDPGGRATLSYMAANTAPRMDYWCDADGG